MTGNENVFYVDGSGYDVRSNFLINLNKQIELLKFECMMSDDNNLDDVKLKIIKMIMCDKKLLTPNWK